MYIYSRNILWSRNNIYNFYEFMYFEPFQSFTAMLCQVGVPAAVALLAALTAALSTNDCRDRFHCFNQIYPECNNTASPLVNGKTRPGRSAGMADPSTDAINGLFQIIRIHPHGGVLIAS